MKTVMIDNITNIDHVDLVVWCWSKDNVPARHVSWQTAFTGMEETCHSQNNNSHLKLICMLQLCISTFSSVTATLVFLLEWHSYLCQPMGAIVHVNLSMEKVKSDKRDTNKKRRQRLWKTLNIEGWARASMKGDAAGKNKTKCGGHGLGDIENQTGRGEIKAGKKLD